MSKQYVILVDYPTNAGLKFFEVFFFHVCSVVCVRSFVGRYRKNLPLKINYSYIGVKLCDGPALEKVFLPENL